MAQDPTYSKWTFASSHGLALWGHKPLLEPKSTQIYATGPVMWKVIAWHYTLMCCKIDMATIIAKVAYKNGTMHEIWIGDLSP